MKKIFLIMFLISLIIGKTYSQNNLQYLANLDGEGDQKLIALHAIIKKNLREYLPYIEERYDTQETIMLRYNFIKTLHKLEHPDAKNIVLYFLDNIDAFESIKDENRLEYKANAVILLFDYADYSQSHFLLDYLNTEDIGTRIGELSALRKVYTNVPEYREQVINILLKYFIQDDEFEKHLSLTILDEIDYKDLISLCLNSGVSSSDEWTRNYSYSILSKRNYSGFRELIRQKIYTESSDRIRFRHAGNLINTFGEPSDIKFILDYLPKERNSGRAEVIGYLIEDFIPRNPAILTREMIDSLNSYIEQLFEFGWIKGQSNYWSYKRKTENLKKHFQNNNTQDVCSNLSWIISEAESQRGSDSLTEEGYKFLFYYTGFIKEKIEIEFGVCE